MTKPELIQQICGATEIDESSVKTVVEELVNSLANALVDGESVSIDGLGFFTPYDKEPQFFPSEDLAEPIKTAPKEAQVLVDAYASYGCDCMGCGYDSRACTYIETTPSTLRALKILKNSGLSLDDKTICEIISSRKSDVLNLSQIYLLQQLDGKIAEFGERMQDRYWVFEYTSPCERDSLEFAMYEDYANGIYDPEIDFDEFLEAWKSEYYADDEDEEDSDEEGEDADEEDEINLEEAECEYWDMVYDQYREWVFSHNDIDFVASRVGYCGGEYQPISYVITIDD